MNLLLTNANIYTVNPRQPRAAAIAIVNDRIVAVGTNAEIEGIHLPNAQRIDMRGAFVLPGLIDSHLHLQYTAIAMLSVDLDEVPSLEEAVRRVRARCEHAAGSVDPGLGLAADGLVAAEFSARARPRRGDDGSPGDDERQERPRIVGEQRRTAHGRHHARHSRPGRR